MVLDDHELAWYEHLAEFMRLRTPVEHAIMCGCSTCNAPVMQVPNMCPRCGGAFDNHKWSSVAAPQCPTGGKGIYDAQPA
jgi:predicted amidophosphoribosyltransferase